MGRRVLVTRLGWFLSHQLARRLEQDPEIEYILGVDTVEPRGDLERTEFLRADIRRPVMLKILEATGIDTVVHCGVYSTAAEARGRQAMHDLNVIGAMQLLGACQKTATVKRVIVRGSTAVYGADPADPAVFTEEMGRASASDPFARDCIEMEGYVREFRRRRRDVEVTLFRFANIVGPGSDTPLAQYLRMPVIPTVLGFDPRVQFLHERDAADVLELAIKRTIVGTYNVAGEGVMFLSQVIRTGRRFELPVPLPLLKPSSSWLQRIGLSTPVPPHILRFLQWGRVADTSRLVREFGFTPRFSTADVVREFYADERLRRVAAPPPDVRWERELHDFLTRKGQERFLARARITPEA